MCALREPVGDMAELECMHHFLSSLFQDSFNIIIVIIIIIIIIIIYNSILCPTKQKEKGKRLHYVRCGNSLLNHGNISMFNRA